MYFMSLPTYKRQGEPSIDGAVRRRFVTRKMSRKVMRCENSGAGVLHIHNTGNIRICPSLTKFSNRDKINRPSDRICIYVQTQNFIIVYILLISNAFLNLMLFNL